MSDLGIYGLEFENNIISFKISTPQICLTAKFTKKTEMFKFGIKSALFGYLLVRILKV